MVHLCRQKKWVQFLAPVSQGGEEIYITSISLHKLCQRLLLSMNNNNLAVFIDWSNENVSLI
jgi:hypothetical protein